jgi:murein endopeptidase
MTRLTRKPVALITQIARLVARNLAKSKSLSIALLNQRNVPVKRIVMNPLITKLLGKSAQETIEAVSNVVG